MEARGGGGGVGRRRNNVSQVTQTGLEPRSTESDGRPHRVWDPFLSPVQIVLSVTSLATGVDLKQGEGSPEPSLS